MTHHNKVGFLGDVPFLVHYTQWQGQYGCDIEGTDYRIQVGFMQHGNGVVYSLVPFHTGYDDLPHANHLNILEYRDCNSYRWHGSYVSIKSCLSALRSLISFQIWKEDDNK
jgi:hypothetical protein